MAIYHCSIKTGSRAKGQSAIAAAAYRAGAKLTDPDTGAVYDYTKKGGVVHSEIALCEYAPAEYADRQTLWSAVHQIERPKDARLWREIEAALPKELSRAEQIETVRDFVRRLTAQGMCADWSLHDKGDGNPHVHIMLTVRSIKPDGTWAPKSRKVYDLDANGEKIFQKIDRTGRRQYKSHKEDYNSWNASERVEEWRAAWAECCNARLSSGSQVDHRSYARQGVGLIPTVHEGFAARKMVRAGYHSDRVQMNADIMEARLRIQACRAAVQDIRERMQRLEQGTPHILTAPMTERERQFLVLDLEKAPLFRYGIREGDGGAVLSYTEFDAQLIEMLRKRFTQKCEYFDNHIRFSGDDRFIEIHDAVLNMTYCFPRTDRMLPDRARFMETMLYPFGYTDAVLGGCNASFCGMMEELFVRFLTAEQRRVFYEGKPELPAIVPKKPVPDGDAAKLIRLRDEYVRQESTYLFLYNAEKSTRSQELESRVTELLAEFSKQTEQYCRISDAEPVQVKLEAAGRLLKLIDALRFNVNLEMLHGRRLSESDLSQELLQKLKASVQDALAGYRADAQEEMCRNGIIEGLHMEGITRESSRGAFRAFSEACRSVPEARCEAVQRQLYAIPAVRPLFMDIFQNWDLAWDAEREAKRVIQKEMSLYAKQGIARTEPETAVKQTASGQAESDSGQNQQGSVRTEPEAEAYRPRGRRR